MTTFLFVQLLEKEIQHFSTPQIFNTDRDVITAGLLLSVVAFFTRYTLSSEDHWFSSSKVNARKYPESRRHFLSHTILSLLRTTIRRQPYTPPLRGTAAQSWSEDPEAGDSAPLSASPRLSELLTSEAMYAISRLDKMICKTAFSFKFFCSLV